ncbi:MAG: hypothetical protein K2I46_04955 [Clostridia bacterium]|nr:hypothetical protein [Clostridia bacterium]
MIELSPSRAYSIFLNYCDEVANSSYLLSGRAIQNLLKFVASTPCLTNYLAKCNSSIKLNETYNSIFGETSLNLPQENMAVVSVVTKLLFDIDRNNIDMDKFLSAYYKYDDYSARYSHFCNTVLVTYAKAFGDVVSYKEKVVEAEEEKKVDNSVKEEVSPYIAKMAHIVEGDSLISDAKKDEIVTLLDGLYYSFDTQRAKIVKAMWIGLLAVADKYKPLQSYIKEVKKILDTYALI